jgi:hypothetical protein
MRNVLFFFVAIMTIFLPTATALLTVQRVDHEHISKRKSAERWTSEMGWRPVSISCQFASSMTILWGQEHCIVTSLQEDGDVFSVQLSCESNGCAYLVRQQIR